MNESILIITQQTLNVTDFHRGDGDGDGDVMVQRFRHSNF